MEIANKSMMISFAENVTIGDLSATLIGQVFLQEPNPKDIDIDFIDIVNIKYRGISMDGYDNWRKFREFHKGMGIDYDELLDQEFEKIFTKKAICELVNRQKFKF